MLTDERDHFMQVFYMALLKIAVDLKIFLQKKVAELSRTEVFREDVEKLVHFFILE